MCFYHFVLRNEKNFCYIFKKLCIDLEVFNYSTTVSLTAVLINVQLKQSKKKCNKKYGDKLKGFMSSVKLFKINIFNLNLRH